MRRSEVKYFDEIPIYIYNIVQKRPTYIVVENRLKIIESSISPSPLRTVASFPLVLPSASPLVSDDSVWICYGELLPGHCVCVNRHYVTINNSKHNSRTSDKERFEQRAK